jgi:glycerophosphoryl diester phosphodiesterase
MSGLVEVVASLAAGCAAAAAVGVWAVLARRQYAVLPGAHAHNDYHQRRPLVDALRHGYVSVEADVWPVDGELLVGHDLADLEPYRTLRRLYLDPLARRVADLGAVYRGHTEPFQLVIEIKAEPETSYRLLDAQLREYAGMLTRFEGGQIVPGAVTVVVGGKCPRAVLAAQEVRYAGCEGSFADLGGEPASLVPVLAEKLGWRFSWRGEGPMPDDERAKLRRLVQQAHDEGRKVRFWNVPKPRRPRLAVWRELSDAGVDYLGADRLRALRVYLSRLRPPAGRHTGDQNAGESQPDRV